jgi:hypothetical protein
MTRPLLLLFALAASAALAAEPDANARSKTFSTTLEAGKIHEECMRLGKGERRRYDWKADTAVDFNIHYHDAKEVFYPVKRDGTRVGKGTFRAKIAQDYCWMWTAKVATKVEGKIR